MKTHIKWPRAIDKARERYAPAVTRDIRSRTTLNCRHLALVLYVKSMQEKSI